MQLEFWFSAGILNLLYVQSSALSSSSFLYIPRHITRLFISHCFSSSFLSPACFLSVVQSAHLFLFVQFVITVFHRAAFIALLLCFITAQINWKWNHKPIAARPEAIYVRGNIICWSSFRELLPGKCARCLSALQIIHAFLQVVW